MKHILSLVRKLPAPQQWLLLVGTFLVFFFLLVVPPFQKPDEEQHFFRTISIARGVLACPVVDGKLQANVPDRLAQLPEQAYLSHLAFNDEVKFSWKGFLHNVANSSQQFEINTARSCSLPFIPYLFTSIVLVIPVFLQLHPIALFFLGRFVQALLGLALWLWALYVTPKKYRFIPLFMLVVPMVAHQLGSYSKDVLHLGLGVVALGYWLQLLKQKINSKKTTHLFLQNVLLFAVTLIGVVLARPQYLFILLLIFSVLPAGSSANKKYARIGTILIAVVSFILVVVTVFASIYFFHFYSVKASFFSDGPAILSGINPQYQITFLRQNPLSIFSIGYQTLLQNGWFYFVSMVGNLGWLDNQMFIIIIGGIAGGFFAMALKLARLKVKMTSWQLTWSVVSLVLVLGSIFFSFYVYGSAVASKIVEGVQGRYFLVLVPFVVVVASQLYRLKREVWLILFSIIMIIGVMVATFSRYYKFDDHYYPQHTEVDEFENEDLKKVAFKMTVTPGRKMRGLVLKLDEQLSIDDTYTIRLMDSSCSKILAEANIPFNAWTDLRQTSVLFKPFVTDTHDPHVCVKFIPFGNLAGDTNSQSTAFNQEDLEIEALYIY